MYLNTIKPAKGSKTPQRRVGRGIGSGFGKTCGRGHKGIKSRSGGGVKPGFEGGQQPLQRRLPKFGFSSRVGAVNEEVRLGALQRLDSTVIDLDVLKAANLVGARAKSAKIFLSGSISRKITVKGLRVSKGAKEAITSIGGQVEE